VGKFGFGMLTDVFFEPLPVSLVVAYSFARSTNGEHAAQRLDLGQRFLEFLNQFCLFFLGLLQCRDVTRCKEEA
jgi:hypothetical protein